MNCLLTSSIVKEKIYRAVKYKLVKLRNRIIQYKPTKCTFSELIFLFAMSSACFEGEGSSSGRRFYIKVWYRVFYMHQYKLSYTGACMMRSLINCDQQQIQSDDKIK